MRLNVPKITGQRLRRALIQAVVITLCALLCFLLMRIAVSGILVASIASTCFIAFAFPLAESARPRYLIGGYLCAVAAGFLCAGLGRIAVLDVWVLGTQGVCGILAVLICATLMLLFDFQHPPAVALAVSIAVDPSPWLMGAVAVGCALFLCVVKSLALPFVARLLEPRAVENEETLPLE